MQDSMKMFFHEWFDKEDMQLKLEIAHYFANDEVWVRKKDLHNKLGLALTGGKVGHIENGRYKAYEWDDIKDFEWVDNSIIKYEEDNNGGRNCFKMDVGSCQWRKFENIWLPCPFFELDNRGRSKFSAPNWCRFMLVPQEVSGNIRRYTILVAFDTRTAFPGANFEDEDRTTFPVFTIENQRVKPYALCNNEYELMDFCSKTKGCEWVDEHILKLYHGTNKIDQVHVKKPKLSYLAQYIFILKWMQEHDVLPKVDLISNRNVEYCDVDLIIDIGNSRTCAILCNGRDLSKITPLKLQNFSNPIINNQLNNPSNPFDMRLAFHKVDFGVDTFKGSRQEQFVFPSLARLGYEANELIHKAINTNTGIETITSSSSPKRYLWDDQIRDKEWEFITESDNTADHILKLKGITNQLTETGTINFTEGTAIEKKYTRSALMTFAMLEIQAQAFMQINSYEFRHDWGDENKPRRFGRIIVSCPTAMSRMEQTALRRSAEDAAAILERFYNNSDFFASTPLSYSSKDEETVRKNILVIPSTKSLKHREEYPQWIYDEASCPQFVYLYAELAMRYKVKNNPYGCKDFFDLYGKVRKDLDDSNNEQSGKEKKTITIGSVDIGAGTTDMMIAAYRYDDAGQCTLTPIPLFWESFYLAGDDMMKKIIRSCIIEGEYAVIPKKLKEMGDNRINEKILDYFGLPESNRFTVPDRRMRSDFNLQVSVPVASRFLQLLSEDKVENTSICFEEMFLGNMPTNALMEHFKKHFGFGIDELTWTYDKKLISKIVVNTFESLISKLSPIIRYYGVDILLLSGRPTSLKPLTDLFIYYGAVKPDHLITLNDYEIGKWYPFQDGRGYIKDTKSIVTVGAMIGNYTSQNAIEGFSLNLTELGKRLLPTTKYFALAEREVAFISPENNSNIIEVSQFPVRFWTRQENTIYYPTRPFYILDFDLEVIRKKMIEKHNLNPEDKNEVTNAVQREIDRIRNAAPLKIKIKRENYNEDRECLYASESHPTPEEIVDANGNDLPVRYFKLSIQSMNEDETYWLDSGGFTNISNNQ